MNGLTAFVVFCSLVCCALAGCPSSSSVRQCAIVYEHSHRNVRHSCFGASRSVPTGDVGNLGHWNDRISSLVVRRGCTLKAWVHSRRRGQSRSFHAGVTSHLAGLRRGFWFSRGTWNDAISSYECSCSLNSVPIIYRKMKVPGRPRVKPQFTLE